MRSRRIRLAGATIAAAYLLFVTSMFLPATNILQRAGTPPGTPLSGWQALSSIQVLGAQPLVFVAEPRALLLVTFPALNLLMLLSPLFVAIQRGWSFWLAFFLVPGGLLLLALPESLTGDLYVGIYAWIGSLFLMSAGCIWLGLGSLWWPSDFQQTPSQWAKKPCGTAGNGGDGDSESGAKIL